MISRMKNRRDLKRIIILRIMDKIHLTKYDDKYPKRWTELQNTTINTLNAELNCKPHENTACVFLVWTSLKMKIDCD